MPHEKVMHSNIVVINLSEQPENEKFSSQLMVVSDIDAPLKICVAELEKQPKMNTKKPKYLDLHEELLSLNDSSWIS